MNKNYKHKTTGRSCNAAQYIAEMVCLREAEKQNVGKPAYALWNTEKWKKKLSDLAQGLGQSAPPEWMPLPDEGEISGRAADSRVEVPKQTSERVTRERVPQIITKHLTKANRDRANEVTLQLEPHVMYTLNYSEHGR